MWAGSSGLALLEAILLLGHIQFESWWIGAAGMEVGHEGWTRRGATRLSGVSDGVWGRPGGLVVIVTTFKPTSPKQ